MLDSKFLGFKTCDPLRAYNTIEPRPRQADFSRSLGAEIYDPLWLLTRQWQFGELQGEDTGSAIFAKVCLETTKVTQFKTGLNNKQVFNDDQLLERMAESELPQMDYKSRLQGGQYFLKLLTRAGAAFTGAPAFDASAIKILFKSSFTIQLPDGVDLENDTDALIIEKSRIESNRELQQFLHTVNGRAIDGVKLYEAFTKTTLPSIPANINNAIPSSQRTLVKDVAAQYVDWFKKEFGLPEGKTASAWVDSQMEYQFACSLPNASGDNTVLSASEYYDGNLDWYSFDVAAKPQNDPRLQPLVEAPGNPSEFISEKTLTVIPTEARFGGMPNSRWWEFEDGSVDLGNINANTTDIAKIILTQFALVFSNDWFVVPYDVPAGSLSKVKGIVVTDVFGQKTFVEAANQGQTDDWMSWGMFNLSTEQLDKAVPRPADTRLFFPPVVSKIQEGDPVCSVNMLRDEMANTVWGVEDKVPDYMGRGRDGNAAVTDHKNLLEEYVPPVPSVGPHPDAVLQYQLGNTVPENWIPFLPRHSGDDNRAIVLQRASMPRLFNDNFTAIRPQTDILRPGIARDPAKELWPFVNSGGDSQPAPYFLNEEEVPRAGSIITSSFQRARWYNGKTFTWYGRRKTMGRGEAGSGLRYDSARPIKK
ncbi:MAG: hypothetical protein CL868_10280 [Cytophagaceae bacterium]|nr:hypothetical protein [Cytophagaceae bacterium]|tara:strand:+ start:15458 stop:17398 length:1941 start_codon:yes stop_codon:yes gene_type:complete